MTMDVEDTLYGSYSLCLDCNHCKDPCIGAGIDHPAYINFCSKRNEEVRNVGICKYFENRKGDLNDKHCN